MMANAAWGHLAEGTKEWQSKEDGSQQASSLTTGNTGAVLRALCASFYPIVSAHTAHCIGGTHLPSEL